MLLELSQPIYLYLAWFIIATVMFMIFKLRQAAWSALFSGWILLPPAAYPMIGREGLFPYWIIGGALPSDVWCSKFWIVPVATLILLCIKNRAFIAGFIPHWTDFGIVAFCLWPLVQALEVPATEPAGWTATLYLAGSWGVCWLLGRLFLQTRQDVIYFADVLAKSTLFLIPVAIVEGLSRWRVHTTLLGVHPFAFDGVDRYLGFRPQALFEHGNQYGIWCAGAAVAGYWLWLIASTESTGTELRSSFLLQRRKAAVTAAALAVMTVASQSAGAIITWFFSVAFLTFPQCFSVIRRLIPAGLLASALLLAVHISGTVPIRKIVEDTTIGKGTLQVLRASGRGSFAWRVSQDMKTLPLIRGNFLWGSGKWNWFASAQTRPWGLVLLILGQFGLVSLAAWSIMVGGKLQSHLVQAARRNSPNALVFCLLSLFLVDAMLNSFIFTPAMVLAGAILHLAPSVGRENILPNGSNDHVEAEGNAVLP